MAIANMSRFSVALFEKDRENVLKSLQRFKYVHFYDLSEDEEVVNEHLAVDDEPEKAVAINEKLKKVSWAISELQKTVEKPKGLDGLNSQLPSMNFEELEAKGHLFDYEKVYDEIRKITDNISEAQSNIESLDAENLQWRNWSDLNVRASDLRGLKESVVILGNIPKRFRPALEEDLKDTKYTYLEFVGADSGSGYFLIITNEIEEETVREALRRNNASEENLSGNQTPKETIAKNESLKRQKEEAIKGWQGELVGLQQEYLDDLKIQHEYLSNLLMRSSASSNFLKTQEIVFIEGYVPTIRVDEFKGIIEANAENTYHLEIQDADRDDPHVPIILENGKVVRLFEPIIETFSLPRYNEIDPTPLMMPFYWFFFGMMVADIGYGLLLLIATTYALKRFKFKESMETFVKFFQTLSIPIILWGAVYGSFLGGIIPLPALINTNTDYMVMVIMSIVFGLIHIFFGLAVQAYMKIRDGDPMAAVYDVVSWYMALGGAIVFILSGLMNFSPIIRTIGLVVMVIGMVIIVGFSARDESSVGARFAWGAYNLYGISSYVGDLVSYTRLAALALSGGFIGVAVNMIVGMLNGAGIVGIIAGVIVFVIFHLFNLFLSVLSAYVHDMRLTYVEYFGKFYEGGGTPFKKFRSQEKYIEIK